MTDATASLDISQVIPKAEMDELMGDYKRAAGYAKVR